MHQLRPVRYLFRSLLILALGPFVIVKSANCTSRVNRIDCEKALPPRYHRYEFAISDCAQGGRPLKAMKTIGKYAATPIRESAITCPGYDALVLESPADEKAALSKIVFVSLQKFGTSCSLSVVIEQEPICHNQSFSAPPADPAQANSNFLATMLSERLIREWKMVGTVPGTFENWEIKHSFKNGAPKRSDFSLPGLDINVGERSMPRPGFSAIARGIMIRCRPPLPW